MVAVKQSASMARGKGERCRFNTAALCESSPGEAAVSGSTTFHTQNFMRWSSS
jgi:hypothetical protein